MTDLVLYSDRVVLDEPLRVAPARIGIAGPWITEVTELPRAELSGEAIDLGGRLVSPAFVNGHTHLAMSALRGLGSRASFAGNVVEDWFFRVESTLEPDDIRAFTRLGAYESLLSGVGAVWDHYYAGEAVAEALLDTGLAGVVAPTLQDRSGPGCRQWERQLAATAEIAGSRRCRDGSVGAAVGPHATDTVSPELWREVLALSTRLQLPVHVHLAQSVEEYERSVSEYGVTPLGQLGHHGLLEAPIDLLLVHDLFLTDGDLGRLNPQRHVLGCCPCSQLRFAFPADPLPWLRAGIPFLIGTDCAPSNDSMNVQKELRLVAGMSGFRTTFSAEYAEFRRSGAAGPVARHRAAAFAESSAALDPARLLASVWSIPGRLHRALPGGRVRPGHLASLAVWDLDHPAFWPGIDPLGTLVWGDTTGAIDSMLVGGRFVGERGRFHRSILEGGAYREALREANQRLARLTSRLGG